MCNWHRNRLLEQNEQLRNLPFVTDEAQEDERGLANSQGREGSWTIENASEQNGDRFAWTTSH